MKRYIIEAFPFIIIIVFIFSIVKLCEENKNENDNIKSIKLNIVEFGLDNHDYIYFKTTNDILHSPNCHCHEISLDSLNKK